MPDLTRTQFCDLTKLSADSVSSLARRNQLPFLVDQKASGRGYSFFEAFLTIISQSLIDGRGINVTRAAEISAALPEALRGEWPRIVETAWKLCEGSDERVAEIMCGQAQMAGLRRPEPVCGTFLDIAQAFAQTDSPSVGLTLTNASRALAVLINRANRINLDIIEDFWSGPFMYRERLNTLGAAKKSMLALLADVENPDDCGD